MSKGYLLDTNVVSHIMQGRDAALLARLTGQPVADVLISSITLAELEYGLHRKGQPTRLRAALTQVLLRLMCCLGMTRLPSVMARCAAHWRPRA